MTAEERKFLLLTGATVVLFLAAVLALRLMFGGL